jgi:putative protease
MAATIHSTTPDGAQTPPATLPRRPEILAPAGDWDCVHAAVENGADAVYFGLDRFNARMRAKNFTAADLPELMAYLHRRGVRGYLTFNTLVFADELAEAESYLRVIIAAGVDAAIVQDVGICRLIRAISPDFPIHCSTQMTITSAAGLAFAEELGASLVVLARENSLKEIAAIQTLVTRPSSLVPGPSTPLLLEVFVHGALCVAYSGQCLTSEALGGRSANRGECAQACRMPYELLADGRLVDLGQRRYLLSPQDLASLDVLPDLIRLGVASFKIEGRLKSPEYVAAITRVYRQAVDRVMAASASAVVAGRAEAGPVSASPAIAPLPPGTDPHVKSDLPGSAPNAAPRESESSVLATLHQDHDYTMEMTFSRGLYSGWFRGTNNQELVHANFGTKRGVFLGEVTRVGSDRVAVRLVAALKPGDGIVFDAGRPEEKEEGGRVYQVEPDGSGTVLRFGDGDIDFHRVQVGDRLWKTSDPSLEKHIRQTFEGDQIRFRRPVWIEAHGRAGTPLTVTMDDRAGHAATVASTIALEEAHTQPLTTGRLQEQLGRLGGTPFQLGEFVSRIEGDVVLPLSELNRLRRSLVEELERRCIQPRRWSLTEGAHLPIDGASGVLPEVAQASQPASPSIGRCALTEASAVSKLATLPPGRAERGMGILTGDEESAQTHGRDARATMTAPELIVVIRQPNQLEAAWSAGARTIYCEFEDPKRYREAVSAFRKRQEEEATANRKSKIEDQNSSIWVAPPRIFKPGEEWVLAQVQSAGADGYLVRNYDHLAFFRGARRRGDYPLNIANPLSAGYFVQRYGLERVTASYDLNAAQLEALLRTAPPAWFEITIHQHMPMFHMEHCVFCAFLTSGTDYRNCGRPCDRVDLRLRDRVGAEFPVKADAGCRNTVFNNRAQTGAEYVSRLLALGARAFRVEFLNESPEELQRTVKSYQQLLRGGITGAELWREFKLINQLGVTRGQMEGVAPVTRRKA